MASAMRPSTPVAAEPSGSSRYLLDFARPTSPPLSPRLWWRRPGSIAGFGAVGVLLIAIVVWLIMRGEDDPDTTSPGGTSPSGTSTSASAPAAAPFTFDALGGGSPI